MSESIFTCKDISRVNLIHLVRVTPTSTFMNFSCICLYVIYIWHDLFWYLYCGYTNATILPLLNLPWGFYSSSRRWMGKIRVERYQGSCPGLAVLIGMDNFPLHAFIIFSARMMFSHTSFMCDRFLLCSSNFLPFYCFVYLSNVMLIPRTRNHWSWHVN